MLRHFLCSTTALLLLSQLPARAAPPAPTPPIVTQHPALSLSQIAFTMGGEIWLADRNGGAAHRITSGAGAPTTGGNAFSPDGSMLAFTATYGGGADVYVIPVAGGAPRRLTFDGAADEVAGWSRDGKQIYFRSTRSTFYPYYGLPRVYTVSPDGGPSTPMVFPVAYSVALTPDGKQAAVEPQQLINVSWKNYRGGDQRQILLVDPATLAQKPLPGKSGNDFDPMWIAGKLYFLSDRDGRTTLYAYDPASQAITRLFDPGEWDIKDASAGPGGIVFAQLDGIGIFDPASGKVSHIDIRPIGAMPGAAPTVVDLAKQTIDAAVSDSGEVAIEARGRILVSAADGHMAIFGGSDHMERAPSFIAPGKVAAFSDRSGTNQLVSHDLATQAEGPVVRMDAQGYYRAAAWSRDGKQVAYLDLMQNLWVARAGGAAQKIDGEVRTPPRMAWSSADFAWSPDGSRLAYSRTQPNGLTAVFVWNAQTGKPEQVTPSDVDAQNPAWDADGKRLWFTASNNTPPAQAYLDQTAKMRPPILRQVFWTEIEGKQWSPPQALPLPARRYEGLYAQKTPGSLLLLETVVPAGARSFSMAATQTLSWVNADADTPTARPLVEGLTGFYPNDIYEHFTTSFRISADRSHIAYRKGDEWSAATVLDGALSGERHVSLSDAIVTVDPATEWRQMLDDSLRQIAYLLHDPIHPQHDFAAWRAHYMPLAAGLGSRQDLTYVLEDVLGELHLSHADVEAPQEAPSPARPATGSLGADVTVEAGRYRLAHIYHAPMFGDDAQKAPLDARALNARQGDWIISINGRPVSAGSDLAAYLQDSAGRSTLLCLADNSAGLRQRCATIVPTANDAPLRFSAWLQERQAMVDRLGHGRVGYIHVSDTVETGMTQFNQARYAQNDRDGFVLDVRYNSGGYAADYFIQNLTAPLLARWQMPQGRTATTPGARLAGPKAMITNAYCGSGCDTYAYFFKTQNIGPIVGTPTWGGVAGSGGGPMLMDGGWITVPQYAMTDPQGHFALEGHAVQPDIRVDYTLKDMAEGRDPQLERAVADVLRGLGQTRP